MQGSCVLALTGIEEYLRMQRSCFLNYWDWGVFENSDVLFPYLLGLRGIWEYRGHVSLLTGIEVHLIMQRSCFLTYWYWGVFENAEVMFPCFYWDWGVFENVEVMFPYLLGLELLLGFTFRAQRCIDKCNNCIQLYSALLFDTRTHM